MKLVFIHGWGFDARLWDGVSSLLADYEQQRLDMGFFGNPALDMDSEPAILIGHSLGFIHGLTARNDWHGWIAINSFPRFLTTPTHPGCVPAAALRDIRMRLTLAPEKTLEGFHDLLGSSMPPGKPHAARLREGLDTLRDSDIGETAANISPGLVIASRHDPLVPAATSEVLAKNKDIFWHEGGGHILPHTDPAFCANAIQQFVEEHVLIGA